jgi:hypothetical protein
MKFSKKTKGFLFLLILFVIILVLGVFLLNNLIDYLSVLEKQELYARVIVSDHYGVDVNSSALIFGMIAPGSSSTRKTTITNDHNQKVNVEILVEGDIEEFLQISENDFDLKTGESKELIFTAISSRDKELRTYDGKVFFIIKNVVVK